jgi:hypothetical protein
MASISSPATPSNSIHRRGDRSRGLADRLAGPLFFSAVGLLTDCIALAIAGEPSLMPLRVALTAGAAPLAALVALRFCR